MGRKKGGACWEEVERAGRDDTGAREAVHALAKGHSSPGRGGRGASWCGERYTCAKHLQRRATVILSVVWSSARACGASGSWRRRPLAPGCDGV